MRTKMSIMAVTILATAVVAQSQNRYEGRADRAQGRQQQQTMGRTQTQEADSVVKASELLDFEVVNYQGDSIGDVEEIVLNRNLTEIDHIVVTAGGILGMGQDRYSVPVQSFDVDSEQETLVLRVAEDRLSDAPSRDRDWSRKVSNLIGMPLERRGEEIGEVDDLVIDMEQGIVAYAIVSLDNLGDLEGDRIAVLPWSTLSIRAEDEIALITVQDTALRAVAFRSDDMPNLSSRRFGTWVHTQFNQEPYWTVYGFEGEDRGRVDRRGRDTRRDDRTDGRREQFRFEDDDDDDDTMRWDRRRRDTRRDDRTDRRREQFDVEDDDDETMRWDRRRRDTRRDDRTDRRRDPRFRFEDDDDDDTMRWDRRRRDTRRDDRTDRRREQFDFEDDDDDTMRWDRRRRDTRQDDRYDRRGTTLPRDGVTPRRTQPGRGVRQW